MARLYVVALSEQHFDKIEARKWALHKICQRSEYLAEVYHSVRDNSYVQYTDLIHLLIQTIEASGSPKNSLGLNYKEIRETLKGLLAKYEKEWEGHTNLEEIRKEYANRQYKLEEEVEEIEKTRSKDDEDSYEPWGIKRFFHKSHK